MEILTKDITELLVLPKDPKEVFIIEGGLNPFAQIIKDAVADFKGDASTDEGRKELRKIGAMINKSRDFVDDAGKKIVAELKEMPKKIDANRKAFRDDIDALRAKVIKPLTDYEEAEKARVEALKSDLNRMIVVVDDLISSNNSFEALDAEIAKILADETDWQDIKGEAEATKMQLIKRLNTRKEQLIQIEKDTQERIAREVEAQKAKAEQDAKNKAEEEAKSRLKAEQDAINAEKAKIQAELDAKNAEIKRQQQEMEAKKQEEDRLAKEKEAREANQEHKRKINNEIKDTLMFLGADEALAVDIVKAIIKNEVPHVSINY